MALGALDVIGLADTAYGLIENLINHGSAEDFWGTFTDSNEAILGKLDDISARLDEAVIELRTAIGAEVEDVQQQSLLSALARAESARDLLSSAASSDTVDPSDVILAASHAFRDVLAQAKAITDPAFGTVRAESMILSSFAVSYALSARLEVAAVYETAELSSNKIRRQIDDAAEFFENLPKVVTELAESSVSVDVVSHTDTISVFYAVDSNGDAAYRKWDYSYYTIDASFHFGAEVVTISDTTYDEALVASTSEDIAGRAFYHSLFDGFTYVTKSTTTLNIDNRALPSSFVVADRPEGRTFTVNFADGSDKALAVRFYEKLAVSNALSKAGLGADGSNALNLAEKYRTLTDGVELVAFEAPGVSSDAILEGTDGNDLIVGKSGNDVLIGGGDSDLIRGGSGNDTLLGDAGEDRLIGGEGDDFIDGGGNDDAIEPGAGRDRVNGGWGFDVVRLEGDRADYELRYSFSGAGDRLILGLTDSSGDENLLRDVERIVFDDRTFNILYGTGGSGERGSDTITGDFELVVSVAEDGSKTYRRFESDDLIFSGDETDEKGPSSFVRAGGDEVFSGGGDDIVHAGDGYDMVDAGAGDDLVYGDGDDDILYGGAGNDRLFGGTGNDRLSGGKGNDYLDGGSGTDRVHFLAADGTFLSGDGVTFSYSFEEAAFVVHSSQGTDTLKDVETISFLDRKVVVLVDGSEGPVVLDPSGRTWARFFGTDERAALVRAGEGDDTLVGTSGDDLLVGAAGDDTLFGGAGDGDIAAFSGLSRGYSIGSDDGKAVIVTGADGRDTLNHVEFLQFDDASAPFKLILGTDADESVFGTTGSDILLGLRGDDMMIGRDGDDRLFAAGGDDIADAGLGDDILKGGFGNDSLAGNQGNDRLLGGAGDDRLVGGGNYDAPVADRDWLFGGQGRDTLIGGANDDVLWGGKGRDTFVFDGTLDEGSDVIRDFNAARDVIEISGLSAAGVTLAVSSTHRILLELSSGTTVDLGVVEPGAFAVSDIVFL
ncbi:calcium-binding protein [Pseudodonghicola flavimaris]|uniref:Calcium-binding protein n=1 Tax=Pseudodonghicola flavimaris TaxID=3050036 RepID=A0ABT7F1Y3_9RHOB|nr:calcium-binding protein [Pseudodonghicola flavimaris]MDK3018585.1 calcium-binding protein [Pseudodonghicola flavimaris]